MVRLHDCHCVQVAHEAVKTRRCYDGYRCQTRLTFLNTHLCEAWIFSMKNFKSNIRNDLVPPVMINDLSATLYEHDHLVHLTFTAPGDDEQEGVSQNYEIRTAATASGFEKFREDFFEGDLIPADFYVTQKLFRYFLLKNFRALFWYM